MEGFKRLTNKSSFYISVLIFLVFIFFQARYLFFTIDHISWTSTIDGDITYQVDRLLINAGTPNYHQTSSTVVDYGSELFILAPILKLINFFGPINVLNSYYLITFVHLVCGVSALLLLTTFFNGHNLEKLLWLSVVLLSPLFGYHIAFAKPDSNIVLLMIALSLYFCAKKKVTLKHIVWAIFFSAFGFAIKWWSIFCLPAIAYRLFKIKESMASEGLIKFAKLALWLAILSMIPMSFYMIDDILEILSKNGIHNFMTATSPIFVKLVLFTVSSCFFLLSYFLFKTLIGNLNKTFRSCGIYLFLVIIFTSTYIFLTIPFVASGTYLRSVYAQAFGDFRLAKIGTDQRISTFGIVRYWLSEFHDYHYFSPVLLAAFIIAFVLFISKRKKANGPALDHFYKSLLYFLGSYFLFIFMLLDRNNRAMISMLYPLCMMLPFYFFTYFADSIKKSILVLGIALAQIIYQSNGIWGTLRETYLERDDLRDKVSKNEEWLRNNFSQLREFHMCDYLMPESPSSQFKFHYHWRYYCTVENLKQVFQDQQKSEGWILSTEVFDKFNGESPELFKDKKVTKYSTFFIRNPVHYSIVENI